jgi:hypothetical protein
MAPALRRSHPRSAHQRKAAAVAGLQLSAFPLVQQSLHQDGPELSRARCQARRSRPLTARTVLRRCGKRESRVACLSIVETRTSETDALLCGNHGSIGDSRPIALFGCPREHRVNTETWCLMAAVVPTARLDTCPRTRAFRNRHRRAESPWRLVVGSVANASEPSGTVTSSA